MAEQLDSKASETSDTIQIFTTKGKTLNVEKSLLEDAVNIKLAALVPILAKEVEQKFEDIKLVQFKDKLILDITPGRQQITKEEMVMLVYGACFLASGGGGPLSMGLEFVKEIEQDSITLIKPQIVRKGNSSIIVADLGSPQEIMNNPTLGRTAPLNCTKYMINYTKEKYNSTLSSVYPVEIGAANTIIPFFVASKLGLNVLDADISGRSVPYISDTLLAVNDVPCCPACIAKDDAKDDDNNDAKQQGDPILFDDTKWTPLELNSAIVDQMKKWNVGACGLNLWLILQPSLESFYSIVNTFTIDTSIKLGRVFTDDNLDGKQRIEQVSQILYATQRKRMFNLFSGKLTFFETRPAKAIDLNRAVFTRDDKKEEIAIYGLNENLIAFNLTTKKLQAMGPDGIAFLDNNYQPLDITSIEKYKDKDVEFKILGVEAWDNLLKPNFIRVMTKTDKGLSIAIREIYPDDGLPEIDEYIPISILQKQ